MFSSFFIQCYVLAEMEFFSKYKIGSVIIYRAFNVTVRAQVLKYDSEDHVVTLNEGSQFNLLDLMFDIDDAEGYDIDHDVCDIEP